LCDTVRYLPVWGSVSNDTFIQRRTSITGFWIAFVSRTVEVVCKICIRTRMDPHHFGEPDPHQNEKPYPDSDPHQAKRRIRIRIRINVNSRSYEGSKRSHGGQWTLSIEALRLKMEPRRIRISVVADFCITLMRSRIRSPDPHQSERSYPDPQHWLVLELYRVPGIYPICIYPT
jgi:hypothetical protein